MDTMLATGEKLTENSEALIRFYKWAKCEPNFLCGCWKPFGLILPYILQYFNESLRYSAGINYEIDT